MADTSDSSAEERHLLDLLARSALNDYPNPERVGCPGQEFLQALAFNRKSIPLNDPRLDHVVHCSPCFRELTELKSAAKSHRQRLWIASSAAAAVVVTGVALWGTGTLRRILPSSSDNSTPILAQIDLQNRAMTRGAPPAAPKMEPIRIPSGPLKLSILLPVGSEPGMYQLEVLKDVDKPLIAESGQASIINGTTTLKVSVNTSSLNPGTYLLGIRQPPLDWAFNPIRVE
jgi:hypothetical protein